MILPNKKSPVWIILTIDFLIINTSIILSFFIRFEFNFNQIKIEIYDNGQVDGDTVTIFMNGALLIPAKMLTAKPITINIDVNDKEEVYDIVMFAESMGTIPPNTALMVVTTATNRYEINITSTEQTSGSIRLKVKR
jgi:hypothetical protein